MTLRTRRPERGIRTRLGRLVDTEERQQAVVTALFIGAILLVISILIGAVAVAWYNDNVRPLARVGSVEVGPQQFRDYVRLEQWRILRDESRVTQAQIDGKLDPIAAQARLGELQQQAEILQTTALDSLVDMIYQSQLAAAEGITITDADVDARFTGELAAQEQRHALVVVVEPEEADEEVGSSTSERLAALEQAEEALAAIQAGTDWADVAREFGTDSVSQEGGDLGLVTQLGLGDRQLADKVFELEPGGTTGVVRGEDGAYRIGRVTEIQPAGEDPGLRGRLEDNVSEQGARSVMRYELAAEKLEAKIVSEALAQTPEQVNVSVIYIEGLSTGDEDEAEGEVHYAEIVYAPNSDLEGAPDLAADDPAWAAAEVEAEAAIAQLEAITEAEERETKFAELALDQSDSPTGEDEGDVGFVTRSIPPVAIGDVLWDTEHEEGDLIGPIRGDAAWYVLLFHEKRESVEKRLQAVKDALAQPDADFAEIAREHSDGPQAEDGGGAGWYTREGLEDNSTAEFSEAVFALQAGEISDALELGNGHFFTKILERMVRPPDADQVPEIEATAFAAWYETRRNEAEDNGTIVIPGSTDLPDDLETGGDQP